MTDQAGLSGMAIHVPRLRVPLEAWSDWTNNPWGKIKSVVGHSFRMRAPHESVYTMAANAVLGLIRRHDIDPAEIGFLGLGTESSTDNAAGAIIVKGLLDEALRGSGRGPMARACEVPEFKHACLGGIYGLKGALRYVQTDGRGRKAIVVASDVAEYARGSSGEPTQGAGAVAMLVETEAKLCTVSLTRSGRAADYRGVDFRKPFARHLDKGYQTATTRLHDFPVFNGKYSTVCYVDAVNRALDDFFARLGTTRRRPYFDDLAAIVMHRPYHRMPIQAMAAALIWGMAHDPAEHGLLADLCTTAGVSLGEVLREAKQAPNLRAMVEANGPDVDPTPAHSAVLKVFRESPAYRSFVAAKLSLGSDLTMELGNLYTASLPAGLAAAFDAAHTSQQELAGREILAIGYGSGDAAEVLSLGVLPGWRDAARRIAFRDALASPVDLDREAYERLHDTGTLGAGQVPAPHDEVIVTGYGTRTDPTYEDLGIETYAYVP